MKIGKRKGVLISAAVLTTVAAGLVLTPRWWLPTVAGPFLPAGSRLALQGNVHWQHGQLQLPDIHFRYQQCQAVTVTGLALGLQRSLWQLSAANVAIDSECLAQMPSGESSSQPVSVAQWQQKLPDGHYRVEHLSISSLPALDGQLTLSSQNGVQTLILDGEQLQLTATLKQQQLQISRLNYALIGNEPISLQGALTLDSDPTQWPSSGDLQAGVSIAGIPLMAQLQWQQQQGQLTVSRRDDKQSLLMLPWRVTSQLIAVSGGQWQWPYGVQPLKGGIALNAANWHQGLENTLFSGRMNILTAGKGGKGNVVLSAGPGKLSLKDSSLPLRLTGTANSAALQFYAGLPALLSGPLTSPSIRFQRGALLRMRGTLLDTLEVDEARWPLAGVHLSADGVNGPLQAILQVHDRQYGRYRLQLAGQARDFWPDKGDWQWRYWGRGRLTPLRANWDLQGTGQWQGPVITLQRLSTGFDQIRYGSLHASAPRLILTRPLVWDRNQSSPALNGAFEFTSRTTGFSYGGKLPPLRLPFTVSGQDPDHFQLLAKLSAGDIGPLTVRGRWDGQRLRGQAWWPSQPLEVFQPLIAPDVKLAITGGKMRAQAAFSLSAEDGFQAGGLWVIKRGAAATPDNQLQGVNFSLPFRYRQQRWQFGYNQPVTLTIDRVENSIGLTDVTADLQGYYPWSQQAPLRLTGVSTGVLGGTVSLDELRLPQQHAALLRADHISLSRLVTALHPKQIAMSGTVHGEFPLWVNDPHYIIRDGKVRNDGPLTLRLDQQLAESIAGHSIGSEVVSDALRYMEISRTAADVVLKSNGDLTMHSAVQGTSRFGEHTQQVVVNYHHQENIFMLWKSLNFGSNLQSLLSRHLKWPAQGEE